MNQYDIRPGKYRHYKGNDYEVLGLATHSETGETMVVYRALYGEGYESPPKWQGGRYSATLVKENNQWHIRSLSLVELLDTSEEDDQP